MREVLRRVMLSRSVVRTVSPPVNSLEALMPEVTGAIAMARSPAELGEVLEHLSSTAILRGLVDAVMEDCGAVGVLADASYEHPNGFDKLVLAQTPSGHKVVLHAWWPVLGPRPRDSNLHDHRWHFATRVLTGSYRFTEFEEGPADGGVGTLVERHRYTSRGPESGFGLEPDGRCRLVGVRSRRLQRGDIYLLPCTVIHSIEIDNEQPTVTLFVQGPPVRSSTRVFSTGRLIEDDQVNLVRMAPDEYRHRLRRVLAVVSDAA